MLPGVFPVIIFVLVAIPLVVIAYMAMRRRTAAGEVLVNDTPEERARVEEEFAEAEAFQEKWREEDKEKFHQERLP